MFLSVLLGGCADSNIAGRPGMNQYVQGALANQKGNQDKAIADLEAAVAANPKLTMAHITLGDIHRSRDDYAKSAHEYEIVILLDPYESKNHYYLGLAYQMLERLEEAAVSYQRALKLNNRDANSNMNLGLICLAQGKTDVAVKYLETATILDPKSAAAHANYAVGLTTLGKYVEAESAYHRSLDLNPKQPATLLNLGAVLIRQKKATEAISIMQEVVKESNTAMAHKRLGDALSIGQQYDPAIAAYQAALKIDPSYYLALNEMGLAFISKYKAGAELDETLRQSALVAWRKSLQIKPGQAKVESFIKQWEEKKKG